MTRRRKPWVATYKLQVPKGHLDLKGYVFEHEEHARRWMAQPHVKDYLAVPVLVPQGGWGSATNDDGSPRPYRRDRSRKSIGPGGIDV